MTPAALRVERLRSHRLTAPAASLEEAASHMLAVQSQEFWGGRWALASRTRGAPTVGQVDALFARGELVRAWTQRGTLHIVPARDLGWMLEVTAARQLQASAPRYRELGLDAEALSQVERVARAALRGGNGLTRAELLAVLEAAGIATAAQRGLHAIQNLALRGIVHQGPVIERADAVSREQLFVLTEEHITGSAGPADPLAELFVRYVVGHGPVAVADFAWWSGLTLTAARAARDAAVADPRITESADGEYSAREKPRRSAAPALLALASFEEYYISYADRSPVCADEHRDAVGPAKNGMVRPILLAEGRVVGTWRASTAIGRHAEHPEAEPFESIDERMLSEALARYSAFATG